MEIYSHSFVVKIVMFLKKRYLIKVRTSCVGIGHWASFTNSHPVDGNLNSKFGWRCPSFKKALIVIQLYCEKFKNNKTWERERILHVWRNLKPSSAWGILFKENNVTMEQQHLGKKKKKIGTGCEILYHGQMPLLVGFCKQTHFL